MRSPLCQISWTFTNILTLTNRQCTSYNGHLLPRLYWDDDDNNNTITCPWVVTRSWSNRTLNLRQIKLMEMTFLVILKQTSYICESDQCSLLDFLESPSCSLFQQWKFTGNGSMYTCFANDMHVNIHSSTHVYTVNRWRHWRVYPLLILLNICSRNAIWFSLQSM